MNSAAPAAEESIPDGPAPAGRVRELQDPLNRFIYHPLAFRLARLLKPTGVSPNAVSVASGALVCVAAIFYTQVAWPAGVLTGFACHLSWHVVDGADGDLARLTGKASPFGEFIDGAADYLGHIFMYVMLATILDDGPIGGWAWPLATAAGVSRIVQSNHTETQRREYLWRVYGIPWLRTQQATQARVFSGRGWFSRNSARVMRGYLALGARMAPYSEPIDRLFRLVEDKDTRAQMRRRVRQASWGSLALQKVLGANPRTIFLGLSMTAGTPLWFFVIEAVLLNIVLLFSIVYHNRIERRLLATFVAQPRTASEFSA